MGTFLPFLTAGFAPICPQNKVNSGYQKLSSAHLTYLSYDILPKTNIYSVIYREMSTFLPILTPVFAPICPQNNVNFGDIPKVVTCASYIPLM